MECLEPVDQSFALKLGTIIHDGLYQFYNGLSADKVTRFIEERFNEELLKCEQPDREDIQILQATAFGMWESFPKDLLIFNQILPEVPFVMNFNGMPIEGRLDGLVQLQRDNKWWIREVKTTSLNRRAFAERMNISEQAAMYFWAATRMGHKVEGIVYDALHKPLLKKMQSENAAMFAARIRKDYHERPEYYFQREYVYKSDLDVKNFEDDLTAFQRDLIIKREHGGFYRNHNSCLGFNSECSYKKICFMEKPDELTLGLFYTKKDRKDEVVPTMDAGPA